MCGICGIFTPENGKPGKGNLKAMQDSMDHRGPDGRGHHVSDDGRYQAAFNRLSIIDLETGDQPFIGSDGERVLTGNGEIYNYKELRKGPGEGYPYKSTGDMEVVLPLAAKFGDEFISHLNGMFALALYDQAAHSLLLVRDRLGIKPLYWARLEDGGIIYGSEIKALLASGLINASVDETSVSSYLAHGYVPAPNTLFKGIEKLLPGHLLRIDRNGTVSMRRYWAASPAGDLPREREGIARHLEDLLRDSIRLQLRSDVPLGVLLSGGIDSGLIVALAADQQSRPINTFTVRFQGSSVDETPLARAVAQRYATNHTEMTVSAAGVDEHLPELAWLSDEPLSDPALLPNFLIEKTLGQSLKVALNGTGGDELFAGYRRYFQLPIEKNYLQLPPWLRHRIIEPAIDQVSPMMAWRLRRSEKFLHDRGAYLHDHSTLFPAPLRALIGNAQLCPEPAQARYFKEYAGPEQSGGLYADLNTYLPEDILAVLDRSSMGASVEGRVPFLDHRLVEAALAVPPDIRTPGETQKGLLRHIARPLLPESVLQAPKQGFASPVPAWMESGLADWCLRILTRPRTLERGWWTKKGIERLHADPRRFGFQLYTLLMLELAVRIHVEDGPLSTPPSDGLEAYAAP
jgi:asparagine synthase (glutamine-hydrolysing)